VLIVGRFVKLFPSLLRVCLVVLPGRMQDLELVGRLSADTMGMG